MSLSSLFPVWTSVLSLVILAPAGVAQDPPQPGAVDRKMVVGERGLEVTTDKKLYRHGESVTVTVRVPRDGFLRLFCVTEGGESVQVFPNDYQKENSVKAGQMLVIPDPEVNRQRVADGKKPYELWVELPEGQAASKELVHAVLSGEQFADKDLASFNVSNPFPDMGQMDGAERKSRGLKPTAVKQALDGQATYELTRTP